MNIPVGDIRAESSPDSIKTWDSVMHLNLVLAIEEEFNIQFNHEQIVQMLSVELIIDIIKEIVNFE
jgi:acyl carrier protein